MATRPTRRISAALVLAAGLACTASAQAQAQSAGTLNATAQAQLQALHDLKASWTPAQKKLSSALVVAIEQRTSATFRTALPALQSGVQLSKGGLTTVDVDGRISSDLLDRLEAQGGVVGYASKAQHTVRVQLPLTSVETVASWADVAHVSVPSGFVTQGAAPSRSPFTASSLSGALGQALASVGQGPNVSEGDAAEGAALARQKNKVSGVGVKVCALSNGVASLAQEEASGDLPPSVDVLPGQAGSGDEGTAMLEIVHDLAPSAALGFATADTSEASFADNVRALRFQAGCDIIVDDVSYFDESPFQDGPVAQAVNDVIADGAFYFSSAGNEGNTIDGTSGNYEGDFAAASIDVGSTPVTANDFDPTAGVQGFDPLGPSAQGGALTLFWADPAGQAADDYDLYVLDGSGNVVASSEDVQDGNDNPYERLDVPSGTGLRVLVTRFAGTDRYFQVSSWGGRFEDGSGLVGYSTTGTTRGHSAAAGAFSVGAAPAAAALPFDLEAGDPPNPSGPYPNLYTAAQAPERFTSDGPRRMFFQPDGTPFAGGPIVRQKPDITAADGVTTGVNGFAPFFGTSAASPHAAAIAALALSGNPGLTNARLRAAFEATALDLAPAGADTRSGRGLIRADLVLKNLGVTPQPLVHASFDKLGKITHGDKDAYWDPGETAAVSIAANDDGDGTANSVQVTVTTDDPLVTISPATQSYKTIKAGKSKSKSFKVTLAPTYPTGKPVVLHLHTTYVGLTSPTDSTVSVPNGQPNPTSVTFAYAGPPAAIPDGNAAGVSVSIPVSGVGTLSKVTFSIDGAACSAVSGHDHGRPRPQLGRRPDRHPDLALGHHGHPVQPPRRHQQQRQQLLPHRVRRRGEPRRSRASPSPARPGPGAGGRHSRSRRSSARTPTASGRCTWSTASSSTPAASARSRCTSRASCPRTTAGARGSRPPRLRGRHRGSRAPRPAARCRPRRRAARAGAPRGRSAARPGPRSGRRPAAGARSSRTPASPSGRTSRAGSGSRRRVSARFRSCTSRSNGESTVTRSGTGLASASGWTRRRPRTRRTPSERKRCSSSRASASSSDTRLVGGYQRPARSHTRWPSRRPTIATSP